MNLVLVNYPEFDVIPHSLSEPTSYRTGVKQCLELCLRKSPLPDFGDFQSLVILHLGVIGAIFHACAVTPNLCGLKYGIP